MLLGGFNKKNADVDYAVKCWDQDANLSNTSRLETGVIAMRNVIPASSQHDQSD